MSEHEKSLNQSYRDFCEAHGVKPMELDEFVEALKLLVKTNPKYKDVRIVGSGKNAVVHGLALKENVRYKH